MKILHLCPELNISSGGISNAVLNLSYVLNKLTDLSTIYSINKNSRQQDLFIHEYSDLYKNVKLLNGFGRKYIISIPFIKYLFKNIKKYDIVHIHSLFTFSTLIGSILANVNRKPYIIEPHGSLIPESLNLGSKHLKNIYLKNIDKFVIGNSSAVHFSSKLEADKSHKSGVKIPFSIIVPNGINQYEFNIEIKENFLRKKFNIPDDQIVITFLGRLAYEKGFDTLIPAFQRLSHYNDNVVLVIIGPDYKGYKGLLQDLIKKHSISTHVIISDPLYGSDKVNALLDSDIFVHPSYGTENFGISIAEAMYAKLPVVISNNVGLSNEAILR